LTSTPSPTISAFPKTSDGAARFVRSYYIAYNASLTTGETSSFRKLADASCLSCKRLADFVDRAYVKNGRVEGGLVSLIDVAAPHLSGERLIVTAILSQASGRVLSASGGQVGRVLPVVRDDNEVALRWDGKGWFVTSITRFGQ
jgi:hypothetical protein